MNLNTYFKLFADCIPVKGMQRSIICDLRRYNIDFIPTILYSILLEDNTKTIAEIIEKYGEEHQTVIIEYFEFLVSKDYIFFCNKEELGLFPPLDLVWKSPFRIENAIWDWSEQNKQYQFLILSQLDNLGCPNLQIRCFHDYTIEELENFLSKLEATRIKNVELYLNNQVGLQLNHLRENKRICSITIFNASQNKTLKNTGHCILRYTKETIANHTSCGQIDPYYFAVGIPLFTESQHHNTCLNRKISIDTQGRIKNCPSMQQSFGHINDTTLEEVIQNPAFTKVWNIKKDEIKKCKGCEFRHICTDCRAYLENPKDLYAAPLKCGYNPETCEWEDWSTNPLKEKAIEYYKLQSTF